MILAKGYEVGRGFTQKGAPGECQLSGGSF